MILSDFMPQRYRFYLKCPNSGLIILNCPPKKKKKCHFRIRFEMRNEDESRIEHFRCRQSSIRRRAMDMGSGMFSGMVSHVAQRYSTSSPSRKSTSPEIQSAGNSGDGSLIHSIRLIRRAVNKMWQEPVPCHSVRMCSLSSLPYDVSSKWRMILPSAHVPSPGWCVRSEAVMERGIYSLIHVPKTIYLRANIRIIFQSEKKKPNFSIFLRKRILFYGILFIFAAKRCKM